jgi:lipoyl(octanoyl) transferase
MVPNAAAPGAKAPVGIAPTFSRVLDASRPVQWTAEAVAVAYPDAVAGMEARVAAIHAGAAPELVWLLQHPPLYTAGTSAHREDLLATDRFPVFPSGRGGQHTYHGPGQRIAYVMLDLAARRADLRAFVTALEEWLIRTVGAFGIAAQRSPGRVGVWMPRPDKGPGRLDKIAAIGVRVRHWVSFHGVALNVDPDLEHFSGIVPCGVRDQGVTSLANVGVSVPMADVDRILRREFAAVFGPTTQSAGP